MRRDNYNKAITHDEVIPVLVPFTAGYDYETGEIIGGRDGVVYETSDVNPPLTASYPVAVESPEKVVERLKASSKDFPHKLRKKLAADLALADALEEGNRKRAQSLISGEPLSEKIVGQGGDKRLKAEKPESVLARHITDAVANTRFVVWLDERVGKLRPGLVCGTQHAVVYTSMLALLGRPGMPSLCRRCGTLFQKSRAWHPYCSSRCRINEAMKRYRENRRNRKQRGKAQRQKRRTER
jgi:hypothetical protein